MDIDQDTVLRFLAEAIDQLRALPAPFAREWSNTRILHRSEGRLRMQMSSRPNFGLLVHSPSISAIARFTESLIKDSRFQRWFRAGSGATPMTLRVQADPARVGRSLLDDYLYLVNRLRYDPAHANYIATTFLHSLETGTVSVMYFSLVKGLHFHFGSAPLPNNLSLKLLSDDECCRLIDQRQQLREDEDLPTHQCVIQRVASLAIQEPIPPAHSIQDEVHAVMTALRLLRPENVYSSSLHRMSERPGQLPVDTGACIPLVNRRVADRTYILNESDLPCLVQILERLDGEIPDRVPLAIDRVNSAAERERIEDQIIDLMIAMEALYGDGPPEAIAYKIRLRAATYLCNSAEDRWKMFTFLKEAYNKRSKAVHGDKSSAQNAAPTDLVDRLLECVQHTIRKRLADARKFEAKDWDMLVLAGSTTPPV